MVFAGMFSALNKTSSSIVYIDLSTYAKLIDAGFIFSDSIEYTKPSVTITRSNGTTFNTIVWTDNQETIPGYTIGNWDYTAEHWWDSRSPKAFAFAAGGSIEGNISLTLSKSGTYTFLVGSAWYHRDSGISYHHDSNEERGLEFLLNSSVLFSANDDNNGLQKTITFNGNIGDVITFKERYDEALIYGYYFSNIPLITNTHILPLIYEYNFIESGVLFDNSTLTFANNTLGNVNNLGHVSWSQSDGLTTDSGGALQVPNFTFGGNITIECVFRFNTSGSYNRVFAFWEYKNTTGGDVDGRIVLARNSNDNKLWVEMWGSGGRDVKITDTNNDLAPPSDFIHLVLTYNSDANDNNLHKKIYINGTEVGLNNTNYTGADINILNPATPNNSWIGKDWVGDAGNETTKFLRFYQGIASASEVTTLYNNYSIQDYDFRSATLSGNTISFATGAKDATLVTETKPTNNWSLGSPAHTFSHGGTNPPSDHRLGTGPTLSNSSGILTNTEKYVRFVPPSLGNNFSIEIYFNMQEKNTSWYTTIFSMYDNGGDEDDHGENASNIFRFMANNASPSLLNWSTSNGSNSTEVRELNSTTILTTDIWYHIIITYNKVNSNYERKVYVSGIKESEYSGYEQIPSGAREHFILGRIEWSWNATHSNYQNNNWPINYRYIRFYGRDLTQTEITTLYNNKDN